MRNLFFFLASCCLLALSCTPNASQEGSHSNDALSAKIDSIGQSFIDEGKVMGFSVAVIHQGDTLYNNGFGFTDSLKTKPVRPDNIFCLASISKLIGSTVVMKLVDEQVLDLDNTLHELLPEFPNPEQAQKIRLRHLLSHTSGLVEYSVVIDSIYISTGKAPSHQDYFDFLKDKDLLFEPGTNFSYSNSGFVLMAMIVERATNSSYQDQIDSIINEPHGLHLELIATSAFNPLTSTYFDLKDSVFIHRPHWLWIKGDGGLSTTALDLAHFPSKWASGEIISAASFREMSTPFHLQGHLRSGYGLGVRTGEFLGEPVIGHTGGEQSTWALMMYFPERDLSIVVFLNTNKTPVDAMLIEMNIAFAVLGKEAPSPIGLEARNEDLSSFLGTYKLPPRYPSPSKSITLFQKKDSTRVYRKITGSTSEGQELFYLGKGAFTNQQYPIDRILFDYDEAGQPNSFREYWNGFFFRTGEKMAD